MSKREFGVIEPQKVKPRLDMREEPMGRVKKGRKVWEV